MKRRHPLGHLHEEIRDFIERETEDNIARGMTPEDARDAARRKFGNVARTQEDARAVWIGVWLEQLGQDVRYALRTFRHHPGFAAIVIVTLALGIGANTAIFSAVDDALFRPLPVPEPDRLVNVFDVIALDGRYISSSLPDYEAYGERSRTLASISGFVRLPLAVTAGQRTERVQIEAATGEYFSDTLRLPPVAGRNFARADDVAGAAPVAMIHEDYWTRAFGRDPGVIGRTIRVEQQPFTIVGIVPARFHGAMLHWQDPPQIWIPLQMSPLVIPAFAPIMHQPRSSWLVLIGRLRDGYDVSQAQAELATIAAQIAAGMTARVLPASSSKFWPTFRTGVARSLAVFAVAAGLILLLACLNIANLLLERGQARRREFAIRASLGTSRGRLLRQLLTENALLAVPGFALALLVARGMQAILLAAPRAYGLRLNLNLAIDARTLAICAGLSVLAILLFGLGPAWRGARADMIREPSGGPARHWTRYALVGAQITLATVLLVGGGLFAQSLRHGYALDLGFQPGHLLSVSFTAPQEPAAVARTRQAQQVLLDRVRALPEVEAAGLMRDPLLAPAVLFAVTADGADEAPVQARRNIVGPGFWDASGIGIVRGRGFRAGETAPLVVVNQTLAARLWPDGSDPVGRRVRVVNTTAEVVGVARDAKYGSVWDDPQPALYLPAEASPGLSSYLLVRTRTAPDAVAPAVARIWDDLHVGEPLFDFRTGADIVNLSLEPERVASGMLAGFAFLAIVLAAVGLYGVLAYAVRQRTREYGIRLAIGARPAGLRWRILAGSLAVAVPGVAAGVAASAALMRLIASRLHGVEATDAATFGSAALALALVSMLAALAPALRAARVDPATALRHE